MVVLEGNFNDMMKLLSSVEGPDFGNSELAFSS